MFPVDNPIILYQNQKNKLLYQNKELFFVEGCDSYQLTSQPYEPCLYLKGDNQMAITIHNSFTVDEILDVAQGKYLLKTITGKEYRMNELCELLSCAIHIGFSEVDIGYLEKQIKKESTVINEVTSEIPKNQGDKSDIAISHSIKELTEDLFYQEYANLEECVLDYCLLKIDTEYQAEESHKEAVLFAMQKWKATYQEEYEMDIVYDSEKMKAERIDANTFFQLSPEDKDEGKKPYWYLFLNPPHGSHCSVSDFEYINQLLFPNGIKDLEIYDWSTDWSSYFEDGLEWWGARCVSIYDKSLNRFVVIGASATD